MGILKGKTTKASAVYWLDMSSNNRGKQNIDGLLANKNTMSVMMLWKEATSVFVSSLLLGESAIAAKNSMSSRKSRKSENGGREVYTTFISVYTTVYNRWVTI